MKVYLVLTNLDLYGCIFNFLCLLFQEKANSMMDRAANAAQSAKESMQEVPKN